MRCAGGVEAFEETKAKPEFFVTEADKMSLASWMTPVFPHSPNKVWPFAWMARCWAAIVHDCRRLLRPWEAFSSDASAHRCSSKTHPSVYADWA